MVATKEWYRRVGAVLPEEKSHEVPSGEEAVRAAKKLYRWAFSKKCTLSVELTSGNRYSGIFSGVLYVNPNRKHPGERGWSALVHDLSHNFWWNENPGARPHEKGHAKFELAMRKEVLKRGWLDGALKSKPKPEKVVDRKAVKLARVKLRIEKWESKLKRAKSALVKLRRRENYYERLAA